MARVGDPAEPAARGTLACAKQSLHDLFHWRQRTEEVNEHGESRWVWRDPEPFENPISSLISIGWYGGVCFFVGLLAWTADAFDFHALTIQQVKLSKYYDESTTTISTTVTLTLLLRSIGAVAFGMIGDKYGRKYPLIINMMILGVLQVGSIYCSTFQELLAVRSLFGLFMGGVYGNALAGALEECPASARGLLSGIFQEGYSFGFLIAAGANKGVGAAPDSWKTVFWIGAGLSFLGGILRIFLPESKQYLRAKEAGELVTARAFGRSVKSMLRNEWRIFVYGVVLMTWFNYLSHFSQDNYTTMMLTQKELDNSAASVASMFMKTGGIIGAIIIGHVSQWFGRRRAIIISAILCGCMIPPWILVSGEARLSVTGAVMQAFGQGVWGVIPIHLSELSPPAFRSTFVGTTYQLGNMISSPSTQMINAIANQFSLTSISGKTVPAYGPTMAIATGITLIGIIVFTAVGPEYRGSKFELAKIAGQEEMMVATKGDLEDGADKANVTNVEFPSKEHS